MKDKIHKNKKHKIIKNFNRLFIVPIIGITSSIMFMILIYSNNEIIFYPTNFTYQGFENFVTFYDFPLKLSLVTLTSWVMLVAYRTYLQTKEQFFILNSANLKTKILPKLRPFKAHSHGVP